MATHFVRRGLLPPDSNGNCWIEGANELQYNKFYLSSQTGAGVNPTPPRNSWSDGCNTKYQSTHTDPRTGGTMLPLYRNCVLPNCTGWARGRWLESQNTTKFVLPRGNAGTWYNQANNLKRSKNVPMLGSIMEWSGHVAFVEGVTKEGNRYKVTISESGFSSYPWARWRTGYVGEMGPGTLKGFIYPPVQWDVDISAEGAISNAVPKWDLSQCNFTVGYYPNDPKEGNAVAIYVYLKKQGWEDNPIFALLGNASRESALDPSAKYTKGRNDAYGLLQWDPSSKWKNWANNHNYAITDGFGQLEFMIKEHASQYAQTSAYPISWDDFIHDTTHDVEWLTKAFCKNYERAGIEAMSQRISWAKKWKAFFEKEFGTEGYYPSDPYFGNILVGTHGFSGDFKYEKPNNKHLIMLDDYFSF